MNNEAAYKLITTATVNSHRLWDFLEAAETTQDICHEARKPAVRAVMRGFTPRQILTAVERYRAELAADSTEKSIYREYCYATYGAPQCPDSKEWPSLNEWRGMGSPR